MKNIIETAINAGNFKMLVAAIEKAGLEKTLMSDGPFTVFAPTDEAFDKIPKETLAAVMANHKNLTDILTYHVISGKMMAKDVAKLKEAKTLQGETIKIDASSGVKINQSNVIKTDIECTNGIIHVIDSVLMP